MRVTYKLSKGSPRLQVMLTASIAKLERELVFLVINSGPETINLFSVDEKGNVIMGSSKSISAGEQIFLRTNQPNMHISSGGVHDTTVLMDMIQ